jgi:hypothetical protein
VEGRARPLRERRREPRDAGGLPGPTAICSGETFGPIAAIYGALADRPDRVDRLDEDFLAFATRANGGSGGGPADYVYEYLLVMARVRAA